VRADDSASTMLLRMQLPLLVDFAGSHHYNWFPFGLAWLDPAGSLTIRRHGKRYRIDLVDIEVDDAGCNPFVRFRYVFEASAGDASLRFVAAPALLLVRAIQRASATTG
jgi:hypothetical protein